MRPTKQIREEISALKHTIRRTDKMERGLNSYYDNAFTLCWLCDVVDSQCKRCAAIHICGGHDCDPKTLGGYLCHLISPFQRQMALAALRDGRGKLQTIVKRREAELRRRRNHAHAKKREA